VKYKDPGNLETLGCLRLQGTENRGYTKKLRLNIMLLEFNDPDKEIRKINRVIYQYEVLVKTTVDENQRYRVKSRLKQLKDYKDKILKTFEINEQKIIEEENENLTDEIEFHFLDTVIPPDFKKDNLDYEICGIDAYLRYFDEELIVVLSERNMKLDFKYSIARDNFYHKFKDLQRKLKDYEDEIIHIEEVAYTKNEQLEMKQRNLKRMRHIEIESHKYFKAMEEFCLDLNEDIEQDGSKCLNSNDILYFDRIEGEKYLDGKTVYEALKMIRDYSREVIQYLNIPQIGQME